MNFSQESNKYSETRDMASAHTQYRTLLGKDYCSALMRNVKTGFFDTTAPN